MSIFNEKYLKGQKGVAGCDGEKGNKGISVI
jgi:hypothetical protein